MLGTEENKITTDLDMEELIGTIFARYGYDFSEYSASSFKRRVNKVLSTHNLNGIKELQSKILTDEYFFTNVLEEITVNITDMFRDPAFFLALRTEVIPHLSDSPLIRIWHAGCSSGEEVYAMAILLKEAGLLEKSILYATDINQSVLEKAASAKFPLNVIKGFENNYLASGGGLNFADYFTVKNEKAVFNHDLRERIVFSHHNLAIDQSFNEFNLIVCRNVLIYFNRNLQNKVLKLFSASLPPEGYLALGTKESVHFSEVAPDFLTINKTQRIWQMKS